MKRSANKIFGINQQRGFWLRCFLESALVIAISLTAITRTAHAQIEAPAPYHLPHLRGVFVDAKGNPIEGAVVTLDRDDKVRYSTKTDRAGRFAIKHASGRYWLHVNKRGYSTVGREVVIGEALTYLHSGTLYMIAGPGACSDDCSSVFTSKSKFDHAIRRNTGHYD